MVQPGFTMRTLKRVAIGVGVIALGGAGVITFQIQSNFRKEEYYQKSLQLFNGYPAGVAIIGQPIRTKHLDLSGVAQNWSDGYNARLTIPLKGSKEKGNLHCWANRLDAKENWRVNKLDLEVKGTQWTFYIDPNARDIHKETNCDKTDSFTESAALSDDEKEHQYKNTDLLYISKTG